MRYGGSEPTVLAKLNHPIQGPLPFWDSGCGSGSTLDLWNNVSLEGTTGLHKQGLQSIRCTLQEKNINILLLGIY